jgi:hypothetical protein
MPEELEGCFGSVVSGEYLKKDKFPNPFADKLWVPV